MFLGPSRELTVERLTEILPEVLPARGWSQASTDKPAEGKSSLLLFSCLNIASTFRSEPERSKRPAKRPRASTGRSRAGDNLPTSVKVAPKPRPKATVQAPAAPDAMDVDGMYTHYS